MKVDNLEQFKLEVNKALLSRDTSVRLKYESMTFSYSSENRRWEITQNKILHCDWGPAVIYEDGTQEWYCEGLLHRIGDPAVIHSDGTKEWWVEGLRHRTDGPAVIRSDGTKEWYCLSRLHRIDGVQPLSDQMVLEWWVESKSIK